MSIKVVLAGASGTETIEKAKHFEVTTSDGHLFVYDQVGPHKNALAAFAPGKWDRVLRDGESRHAP